MTFVNPPPDMRRFRSEMLSLARVLFPDHHFADGETDEVIEFESCSVYLTNLYATARMLEPSEREAEMIAWVTALVRDRTSRSEANEAADTWAAARPLLRPRLVSKSFTSTYPMLLHRDFSAKAAVAYALDLGSSDAYVFERRLADWGVGRTDVEAAAIANLETMSAELDMKAAPGDESPLILMQTGDGYDASRLLLPDLRRRLLADHGPTLFAGVPSRDALVIWSATSDRDLHRGLVSWIGEAAVTEPYPITDEVFLFDESGVRLASIEE